MNEYNVDSIAIGETVLEMKDITKIYSNGFVANNKVNFSIRKGEIHGLVGENGAGKSTLMKVLFGQENPEEGSITFCNKLLKVTDPLVALKHGIGMVHQHFMLVDSMTVAENIVLGNEPVNGIIFDNSEAIELTKKVSQKYKLPINPLMKIEDLTVGYKQTVEILKMLIHDVKILLLDEPTAVLTPQETSELFKQLTSLKNQGFSIVFISHKVNEVKEICDRITVLRNGRSITTINTVDLNEEQIANLIVGKEMISSISKNPFNPNEVVLMVKDLSYTNNLGKQILNSISFKLRENEILGVAAVEGNGQSELSDILTGIINSFNNQNINGSILVKNEEIMGLSIKDIRNKGISFIHEDRMTFGSSASMNIIENILSNRFDKPEYSSKGFINWKLSKDKTREYIKSYQIKCDSPTSSVKTLSGGNVQKVVAAREFTILPKLLIANQPTRGIDIGAADLIRNKMVQLRDKHGSAILLFSADLSELLSLSDNIIVLFNGEIVAYIKDITKITESDLGEYMLGLKKQDSEYLRSVLYE